MPYIVTTTSKQWQDYAEQYGREEAFVRAKESGGWGTSRHAVATLDEVRVFLLNSAGDDAEAKRIIAESAGRARWNGGTVGPLPDETIIEVEPILERALWDALDRITQRRLYVECSNTRTRVGKPTHLGVRLNRLIAAYNEGQEDS